MNQKCEIVRDLLWMYEEGECSEGSRHYVEEHLRECEECRKYRESLQIPEPDVIADAEKEPQILKKSFRKIRRRWLVSLVIVAMLLPMLGLGKMTYNEVMKQGVCFSNLTSVYQCSKLTRYLEKGDFDKAVQMMDFSEDYAEILEAEATLEETYYDKEIIVTIPDEGTYAVKPEFAERNGITEDGEFLDAYDPVIFWYGVMYNEYSELLIPAAIWESLVDEYIVQSYMGILDGYIPTLILGEATEWDKEYFKIETPWGAFYTDNADLSAEEITAKDLVYNSGIVSIAIYEAARDDIMAEKDADIESFYEYYAEELAMTEAEYIEMRREECIKALESEWSQGHRIQQYSLGHVYCHEKQRWSVNFNVTVTDAENPNTTIAYDVDDGIITYCSVMDEIPH